MKIFRNTEPCDKHHTKCACYDAPVWTMLRHGKWSFYGPNTCVFGLHKCFYDCNHMSLNLYLFSIGWEY